MFVYMEEKEGQKIHALSLLWICANRTGIPPVLSTQYFPDCFPSLPTPFFLFTLDTQQRMVWNRGTVLFTMIFSCIFALLWVAKTSEARGLASSMRIFKLLITVKFVVFFYIWERETLLKGGETLLKDGYNLLF